jgi:quercetin dioxygenase-like cupin family protein
MKIPHARSQLATVTLGLLGAFMSAEADNANVGFERETLGIGAMANKLSMAGPDLVRTAGTYKKPTVQTLDIHASTEAQPIPDKELHTYKSIFDAAGGHSNWHSHPGLEFDINPHTAPDDPSIEFYIVNGDGGCRHYTLQPGQSLLILPNETHMAQYLGGSKPASLLVERIHPGTGETLPVTRAEPQPSAGSCPQI